MGPVRNLPIVFGSFPMLPQRKVESTPSMFASCYPAQNACDGLGMPFMTSGLMTVRLQLQLTAALDERHGETGDSPVIEKLGVHFSNPYNRNETNGGDDET
jgi:hypothetical protein